MGASLAEEAEDGDVALEAGGIGRDLDRADSDLAAVVPDQERGRPQPLSVDQNLGGGQNDRLGDVRIADGKP